MNDIIGRERRTKAVKRPKDILVRDMVTALGLCNNVTPYMEDGKKLWQASSPDEIALVETAQLMGIDLLSRTFNEMCI
jgi:phospholipid-translocating ATPase